MENVPGEQTGGIKKCDYFTSKGKGFKQKHCLKKSESDDLNVYRLDTNLNEF